MPAQASPPQAVSHWPQGGRRVQGSSSISILFLSRSMTSCTLSISVLRLSPCKSQGYCIHPISPGPSAKDNVQKNSFFQKAIIWALMGFLVVSWVLGSSQFGFMLIISRESVVLVGGWALPCSTEFWILISMSIKNFPGYQKGECRCVNTNSCEYWEKNTNFISYKVCHFFFSEHPVDLCDIWFIQHYIYSKLHFL